MVSEQAQPRDKNLVDEHQTAGFFTLVMGFYSKLQAFLRGSIARSNISSEQTPNSVILHSSGRKTINSQAGINNGLPSMSLLTMGITKHGSDKNGGNFIFSCQSLPGV